MADQKRISFSELANFHPKQWDATEEAESHKYFLFGGSRGPGKSYWLRWWLLYKLLTWHVEGKSGVRVLLACEDYPTLSKRQIVKIQDEFPDWLGRCYTGARREFVLDDAYGGGVIEFGNLADVGNYLSAEYAAIAIDELVRNSFSAFNKLRGSLRWPGIPDTKFVAATNPEANWVRDIWIERRFDDEAYEPLKKIEHNFGFLPALPTDNPSLDESYWEDLKSQPLPIQQAWIHGDWYAAVEGLVYDNFSAESLTEEEPDPERPIELGFDDGYIDPRVVLFVQRTSTGVLVFDEIWHHKKLEEQTIQEVVDRCEANGWPLPEIAVGSSEANQLMTRFKKAGIVTRGGTHKPLTAGISLVRQLICDSNDYRAVKIHKRCKNFIDELSAGYKYAEGKRSLSENPIDANNHGCDAFRYWVWRRAKRGI